MEWGRVAPVLFSDPRHTLCEQPVRAALGELPTSPRGVHTRNSSRAGLAPPLPQGLPGVLLGAVSLWEPAFTELMP